jgi:phosphoglycolate phosphatase
MVHVHKSRGQSPVDVFRGLFAESPGRAEAAALSFDRSCQTAFDRSGLSPMPGADDVISSLRDAGVRVCVVSSLSRRVLGRALDSLGWWRRFDLALTPEDVPRCFPWPDLMLTAMLRLGVRDVREAAFAGTTESGILGGSRSGAGLVAGLLTGSHSAQRLRGAGATHILESITGLPGLLTRWAEETGPGTAAGTAAGGGSVPPATSSPVSGAPSPRVPLER